MSTRSLPGLPFRLQLLALSLVPAEWAGSPSVVNRRLWLGRQDPCPGAADAPRGLPGHACPRAPSPMEKL